MHWRFVEPTHGVLKISYGQAPLSGRAVNIELHLFWGPGQPTMAVWIWSKRSRLATGVAALAPVGVA